MRNGYQNIQLRAVHSTEVYQRMKEQISMKPSFMIKGKFKNLVQAKEYFGKYGTLSKVQQAYSKVRLEYYNREDALKALITRHSKNILFYLDPHPERILKYGRHAKNGDRYQIIRGRTKKIRWLTSNPTSKMSFQSP